ncbi:MAG: PIN domain-containing protein [Thermoplasmatota archaeon]
MTDTADLNLVLARILPGDALHARARRHLETSGKLIAPFSVGMELLFVAQRFKVTRVEALGAAEAHFEIEGRDVLYVAAEALDSGDVPTVFDAVHLADALRRNGRLHTADARLQKSAFPTQTF